MANNNVFANFPGVQEVVGRRSAGNRAVGDLVLMKMPKKQFQAQQATHLARAKQRNVALKREAVGNVGSGLSTINTNFEDGGYRRSVI